MGIVIRAGDEFRRGLAGQVARAAAGGDAAGGVVGEPMTWRSAFKAGQDARGPSDALESYLEVGLKVKGWSAGHHGNMRRMLSFWVELLPLNEWGDFDGAAGRVRRVVMGAVDAGRMPATPEAGKMPAVPGAGKMPAVPGLGAVSADTVSTDSNKDRISLTTLKSYGRPLVWWFRWLRAERLVSRDAVEDLAAVEWPRTGGGDVFRRAYTADELKRLLWVCRPERRLLYEVAIFTGLRASELARLTTSSLDLAGRCLRLGARQTKNKARAEQQLPPRLFERLKAIVEDAGRMPATPEAGKMPAVPGALLEVPAKTARAIYWDLKAAKIDYLDRGRGRLDFHSLRGSCAALGFEAGGLVHQVQAKMRHGSADLTMHYAGGGDQAGLVGRMEELLQQGEE